MSDTLAVNDAMHAFARERLRDDSELSAHRAVVLNALLEETIWPVVGADSPAGRNAAQALKIFCAQWAHHSGYERQWRP